MILEFIAQFTQQQLLDEHHIYQLRTEWFLVPPKLLALGKDLPRKPIFVGAYLGRQQNDYLVPGIALLDLLAKSDAPVVEVNERTAWMFICGKDVLQPGIVKASPGIAAGRWVLVKCKNDVIGVGKVEGDLKDAKSIVKNFFDVGDFLRRERKHPKKVRIDATPQH